MSRNVYTDIDYTSIDYEGLRNDMIACIKKRIPEYTDFSENDFGVVMAELFAHGLDVVSYYVDRHANEMFLGTCKDRKSALKIASQMSYTPANATPAKFYQLFEVDPSDSGYLIPKGFRVKTEANTVEPQIVFEVAEDFFIPAGKTGLEQGEDGEYLYLVPIVQGSTVTREILGTSDGTARQEFVLGYSPVVIDSLYVEVYVNGEYQRWTRVDNFLNSTKADRHFVASVDEYDTVTITFGDGANGQIPIPYENGITATYRVGGGTFGNVGAEQIVLASMSINGIVRTFNPYEAYEKGTDRETLEELRRNIPASVRTLNRAVSLADYENLVMTTNRISSCKAVRTGDLDVTVYVVPNNAVLVDEEIALDESDREFIEEFMREKVIAGASCSISSAYVKFVDLSVVFRPTSPAYSASVKTAIENVLHTELDIGNMRVGQELIISDLISELTDRVSGVRNLRSVMITTPSDILVGDSSTDTTMYEDEVIVLGNLTVEEA